MKKIYLILIMLILSVFIVSCSIAPYVEPDDPEVVITDPTLQVTNDMFSLDTIFMGNVKTESTYPYDFPRMKVNDRYKNFYEIFVGSFNDTNSDGMGDINGVTEKLDYLDNLGINAIWLMPISPSPTYHKYDVVDYYEVDPAYGNLEDFDNLIQKANEKGIEIIIDMVLNHCSNNNEWFQEGLNAFKANNLSNKYTNYFNFSNTAKEGYAVSNGVYYEAHFGANMPDFNWESQDLRDELENVIEFWLEKGVYGFRLDATSHYYTGDHPKNVEVLNWIKSTASKYNPDAYIVGEAWEDQSIIASNYLTSSVDSFFNFPFATLGGNFVSAVVNNSISASTLMERYVVYQDQLKNGNENGIDAIFLSNHDIERSANFLQKNIYLIKFMASLYLMMPGNPFIYYGEEIGMIGTGADENKRRPFVWSSDSTKNTDGPLGMDKNQKEFFPSLEVQSRKQFNNFIYGSYKRLLDIKNQNPEISRGTWSVVKSTNDNVITMSYEYNGSKIYLVYNFSKSPVTMQESDLGITYQSVRGYHCATGENVIIENGNMKFPALSMLVLKA